jgi:hypothetical protein
LKRNVLVIALLVLVAVASVSVIAGIALHPEGMGRGRGGSIFGGVSIYTTVIPMIAIIGILALLIYYTVLPEIPYTGPSQAIAEGRIKEQPGKDESSIVPHDELSRFLETDEKRVYEALREAGGSLLQKEIVWKTGYSKVKTHRIVYRLAKRGIVEVEKYFNTNRVKLKGTLDNVD